VGQVCTQPLVSTRVSYCDVRASRRMCIHAPPYTAAEPPTAPPGCGCGPVSCACTAAVLCTWRTQTPAGDQPAGSNKPHRQCLLILRMLLRQPRLMLAVVGANCAPAYRLVHVAVQFIDAAVWRQQVAQRHHLVSMPLALQDAVAGVLAATAWAKTACQQRLPA
jgi:hypothetical protein